MKGLKSLLALIIVISFMNIVSAWSNTTFNDSSSAGIIVLKESNVIQKFLQIPDTITSVTVGQINLTGYIGTTNTTTDIATDLDATSTMTARRGIQIIPNYDITITNITKNPSDTTTKCYVENSSHDFIGVETFHGVYCGFAPYAVNLSSGKVYYITTNSTVSATQYKKDPFTTPFNRTNIFVNCSYLNDTGLEKNVIRGIVNVTTLKVSNILVNLTIGDGTLVPYFQNQNQSIFINNLSSYINAYLGTCTYVGSNCFVPFNFTANGMINVTYTDMLFTNEDIFEVSQSYNNPVISGTQESFSINVTYDSSFITAISPYLNYNSTTYPATSVVASGSNKLINATIVIPVVSSITTKYFNWSINLTYVNGSKYTFTSTTNSHSIQPLQIDNCSKYNYQIMNLTLFDEGTRAKLNGTIELSADFYDSVGNPVGFFNTSFWYTTNGLPLFVCINSSQVNSSLVMNYHAKYWSNVTDYAIENKFGQNIQITNNRLELFLYDLLDADSTSFQLILQSANLDAISGALIDVQREYIPSNNFISVETPLTDVYGTTIAHLVSENVYYTFVVTLNGTVLGTFNKQLVQCQNVVTGDCRRTLNLIDATSNPQNFQYYGNISVNYLWSASTKTLYTTWLSSNGAVHTVEQNVTLMDNWGNTTICQDSATAVSGSFTCIVPSSYGNTTIVSHLYSDGLYLGFRMIPLGDSAGTVFGGSKVVLGILMYCTLTFMLISNPALIVAGAILGMIFLSLFHIVDGGSFWGNGAILTWFLIAGGIIIFQVVKRS